MILERFKFTQVSSLTNLSFFYSYLNLLSITIKTGGSLKSSVFLVAFWIFLQLSQNHSSSSCFMFKSSKSSNEHSLLSAGISRGRLYPLWNVMLEFLHFLQTTEVRNWPSKISPIIESFYFRYSIHYLRLSFSCSIASRLVLFPLCTRVVCLRMNSRLLVFSILF